jgi:hypothetical protein
MVDSTIFARACAHDGAVMHLPAVRYSGGRGLVRG